MPVTVSYRVGESGTCSGTSQTQHITQEGLCFLSSRPLTVGMILNMTLSWPSAPQALSMTGRIIWSQRMAGGPEAIEYGVEFINPSPTFQQAIATLLRHAEPATAVRHLERRQSPRIVLKLSVDYRVRDVLADDWYVGLLYDMSTAGARLTADRMLELGQTVELRVSTPGRTAPYLLCGVIVTQRAEAARVLAYDHGIRFDGLTVQEQSDLEHLLRFISST